MLKHKDIINAYKEIKTKKTEINKNKMKQLKGIEKVMFKKFSDFYQKYPLQFVVSSYFYHSFSHQKAK